MKTTPLNLRNGTTEPRAIVLAIAMALTDLLDHMDPEHKSYKGKDPMESAGKIMGSAVALHDLSQLCENPEYDGCFGPTRERLVRKGLVTVEHNGTLRVHDSIRNVVLSALTFNSVTQGFTYRNPVAP